jgi:hypothetical protein
MTLPSDFFRRNVVLSFQEDAIGIRLRDDRGVRAGLGAECALFHGLHLPRAPWRGSLPVQGRHAPALNWLIVRYSWHWAFGALGIVGLVWPIAWLLLGGCGRDGRVVVASIMLRRNDLPVGLLHLAGGFADQLGTCSATLPYASPIASFPA